MRTLVKCILRHFTTRPEKPAESVAAARLRFAFPPPIAIRENPLPSGLGLPGDRYRENAPLRRRGRGLPPDALPLFRAGHLHQQGSWSGRNTYRNCRLPAASPSNKVASGFPHAEATRSRPSLRVQTTRTSSLRSKTIPAGASA